VVALWAFSCGSEPNHWGEKHDDWNRHARAGAAGCLSVTGTVTLSVAAPASGITINLSDTLVSASTPATVVIAANTSSSAFTIKTVLVAVGESGTVRATLGTTTLTQDLTVRPMGVDCLSLKPSKVAGGKAVNGSATLECKAGPGPILVELSSTNPAVATPVPSSITVPVGAQLGSFDVATSPVAEKATPSINATANGVSKSQTLTVSP
jgi:hypothetical protein